MKIKDDPDVNSIEMDLLENSKNDKDENEENKNKLYGNDINIKRPKKLGKLTALFYIKDYPLIAIGPNSKQILSYKLFII